MATVEKAAADVKAENRTLKAKSAKAASVEDAKKRQEAAMHHHANADDAALGEQEYAAIEAINPSAVHIANAGRRPPFLAVAVERAVNHVAEKAKQYEAVQDSASNDDDLDDDVVEVPTTPSMTKKRRRQPNRKHTYATKPADKAARAAETAGKGIATETPKTFTKMPRDTLAAEDGYQWLDKGSPVRCRMNRFIRDKMLHLGFHGKPISKQDRISTEFKLAAVVSFLFLYLYRLCSINTPSSQLNDRFADIIEDHHGDQADFLKFTKVAVQRRLKKGRVDNPDLEYDVSNPPPFLPQVLTRNCGYR